MAGTFTTAGTTFQGFEIKKLFMFTYTNTLIQYLSPSLINVILRSFRCISLGLTFNIEISPLQFFWFIGASKCHETV